MMPAPATTPTIRPTIRAVIRRGGLVLVQVKVRADGQRYLTLPGGRQEHGETMQDCVVRECLEEIGCAPQVGAVLHLADVFRDRPDGKRHQSEVLFACHLPQGYLPRMGAKPDKRQTGTIWADLLADGALFRPRYDLALTQTDAPVYLGAVLYDAA